VRTPPLYQGFFPRLAALAVVILGLAAAAPLAAQDAGEEPDEAGAQLWLNVKGVRPLHNKQWFLQADFRTSDDDGAGTFASLGGRTGFNFYPLSWLDLFPEIWLKYTDRRENPNVFNATVTGAVRFRLPHEQRRISRERVPLQRLYLGVQLRLEWRNAFSEGGGSSDSWQARGQIEARFPINHSNISDDKTVYLRSDAEVFVPVFENSPELFANRVRIRAGAGYRMSFSWRIEALGAWETFRKTFEDDFGSEEFILVIRLHHYFH
jgi:hypothetical protein